MNGIVSKTIVTITLLSLLLAGTPVRRAHASAIVVNTSIDHDLWLAMVADGKCGLREAIENANDDAQTDADCPAGSGTDTISFAGNYTITLGAQGELLVTSPIVIQGYGAGSTIIEADAGSGTSTYRVFEVSSTGNLTLDSLTVRNGRCAGSCTTPTSGGGGILNNGGTLSVTNSTLSTNVAGNGGAGVFNNAGTTTISNSVVYSNSALSTSEGGGIFTFNGSLSVTNSSIDANSAHSGAGIASNGSSVTVTGSTFSFNSGTGAGGGMYIYGSGSPILTDVTFSGNNADSGGGLFNSGLSPHLKNVTISGNSASQGGGLYNTGGSAILGNTIIANSIGPVLPVSECVGSVDAASSNNLIEDASSNACGLIGGTKGNIIGPDPKLGPLANNGGATETHALLADSPAIDAGLGCDASDQRGVSRPQGLRCDIGAFELEQTTATYESTGTQDGWILESSENSSKGGTTNAAGTTFILGDNAARKQYRSILSFDTGALPDGAALTSATLRFKKAGRKGANPFDSLGKILADVMIGPFLDDPALQPKDFQAGANRNGVLVFGKRQVAGWYSKALARTRFVYINETGITQFRLRFAKGDNNNAVADYLKFYSGDAATAGDRPQLIITYYVP